jgi:hypothetical protein
MPALPALPALPPAPPSPPPLPALAAEAHAACAGKVAGAAMRWTTADGGVFKGVCEKDGTAMVFVPYAYSRR